MWFRRFLTLVLSVTILVPSAVPARATVDEPIIEYIIVPFTDIVVSGIESIGRVLDSAQGVGHDIWRNVFDFWGPLVTSIDSNDDFSSNYDGFVDELEYTTVTHDGLFVLRPSVHWTVDSSIWNQSDLKDVPGGWDFSGYAFGSTSSYNNSIFSCSSSDSIYIPPGLYNVRTSRSGYWGDERFTPTAYIRLKEADGTTVFTTSDKSNVALLDGYYNPSSLYVNYAHYVSGGWDEGKYYDIGATFELECVALYDSSGIETPDPDSRLSALANSLNQYNLQHSIQANDQNVNFVLMPVGQDTPINPGLYDEEKLVYTDPITGMEYLTTGWTYDYLTRCYTLDMADGFTIGDAAIDTIKLTYGDELLTVDHYSGGSLIQSDEYNYVMMSGSECALNGHTYNYENVSDPTCTSPGERKYTCTVCGDSHAEAIPQLNHVYMDYTVTHEPSCISKGIAAYSCSSCGGEFAEVLDKLGHDWQPTQLTEESFVMPDNVRCPDCYGTNFSFTRSDYEILTGKNLFNFPERDLVDPPFGLPSDIRRFDSNSAYVGLTSNGYSNEAFVSVSDFDPDARSFSFLSSSPGYGLGFPFALTPGKTYSLSAGVSGSGSCYLGFYDVEGVFLTYLAFDIINSSFVVPDNVYWTVLVFRGNMANEPCSFTDIQLEEGSEITEYEPYITKEVEIIPPIYTFTCSDSDCGTVWTEEAEYQGATITYTCTRCGAEQIEVQEIPIEEEGWFAFINDLLKSFMKSIFTTLTAGLTKIFSGFADLIGGIFRFVTDAVLSGIKNFFAAFSPDGELFEYFRDDETQTMQLPSGVGNVYQLFSSMLAALPVEIKSILFTGIAALMLIAVFKMSK